MRLWLFLVEHIIVDLTSASTLQRPSTMPPQIGSDKLSMLSLVSAVVIVSKPQFTRFTRICWIIPSITKLNNFLPFRSSSIRKLRKMILRKSWRRPNRESAFSFRRRSRRLRMLLGKLCSKMRSMTYQTGLSVKNANYGELSVICQLKKSILSAKTQESNVTKRRK